MSRNSPASSNGSPRDDGPVGHRAGSIAAGARAEAADDGPSHPFWKANLLMLGVVVLLVLLAVLGGGGR